MAKKQTIVKKPVGNGNISITIENNLKNTNPAPPPVKRRRRRRQPISDPTDEVTNSKIEDMLRAGGGGVGGGGGLPPFRDVSYIKPGPINNFAVWRDNFNDSYNTTIPQGQAQQMGMLPLPKVEAPPQPQLALTAPPPVTDTPLTMREFAAIMMQQGKARPGYQNLHEDLYNEDEPMEDRYANLRPSSRIEEYDENVLRDNGVTDEQIKMYQEQIQQQKASVSTTNEQKLEAAGIDPEIVKNVKKIAAIKTAGTWQGSRNIKPYGPHIKDPNYIASYNAGRDLWLSQQPEDRKTAINRNKKFRFLSVDEDPWDGSATGLDAVQAPEEEEDVNILELASMRDQLQNMAAGSPDFDNIDSTNVTVRKKIEGTRIRKKGRIPIRRRNKDIQEEDEEPPADDEDNEMRQLRENLVAAGLRKDNKSEAQRNSEKETRTKLSRMLKGYNERKEVRQLKEQARIDKIDADNREIKKQEEQANEREEEVLIEKQKAFSKAKKLLTKGMIRYKAMKDKKAWEKKAKEALEAAIDAVEVKVISQSQEEPSEKSKRIKKAFESITQFWITDTLREAAIQAKKDARQAKKDARKEAEDNVGAKSKALRDRRLLLESQAFKETYDIGIK
jgi:hypothetical protein